ncbi:MAG: M48 family metallopeptidase [Flavobacteriia bacterium]|jgi:predicted Zn-dependent protease
MKIVSITILFLFVSNFFTAQIDFNDFKNLKAEGDIPVDFTENAFSKIAEDIDRKDTKLKGLEKEIFLEGVHYAINDLLHSGIVVYGDEVSNYVSSIADKLLVKDENLRRKLRFYTIKSNETNAFSTYQGIIFVTTGLISQLTNEAQLAYVLSHEIAHFSEDHVVETFDFKTSSKRNSEKIQTLSNFSKENEFEADKVGVKLYYEAGYSKADLISTFDVLLYSYLPFEEIEFSKAYLNSDLMTIPESFYSKVKFPIKAIEDADDSKSSHPNIKKRKEAVLKELENFKSWGNKSYILGEDQFKLIRTISRFESVRNDVVDAQFDDALYSIFVLEKEFPNSIYLKRMKAKAWLGVAQYKAKGNLGNKLPATKDLEGEIAILQNLLKELNKNQLVTVSMRMVEDIRKENPNDVYINQVWNRMIKTFGKNEKFELIKFSKITYKQAYADFLAKKTDTITKVVVEEKKENLSKYDKIKQKKDPVKQFEDFDSSSFYIYAISDLITYKSFIDKFDEYEIEADKLKEEEDAFEDMTSKEQQKYLEKKEREEKSLGINSFIFLEPLVYSYSKKGLDRIKSEKLQIDYSNAVEENSNLLNIKTTVLSSSKLLTSGTEMFNQRSVLMSYFSELNDNQKIEIFPTDYFLLQDIKEKTGTNKVLMSVLEHEKSNKVSGVIILGSVFVYPILLWYIPSAMLKSNEIFYTALVLNIETGKIEKEFYIQSYENINKHTIGARVYNLLRSLN